MKTFIAAFLVVCTIIGPCSSLECYTCDGTGDCADPFNAAGAEAVECPPPTVSWRTSTCSASEDKTTGSFTRGCASAELCSTGCVTIADYGVDQCNYCCDGDRCNSRPVADAVADTLHCYNCGWSSDLPYSSSACNDPFDPNGEGVYVAPCAGECWILKTDTSSWSSTVRGCLPASQLLHLCQPRCDGEGTCTTCCSENLCNGGPVTPKAAPAPNGAPSLMTKERSATIMSLAAILLVYIALVN